MTCHLQPHHYQIGRLGLEVTADQREIFDVLDSHFGPTDCAAQYRRDLQFQFVSVPDFSMGAPSRPTGAGRPLFGSAGLHASYFDSEDLLLLQFEDKVRAHVSLSEGCAKFFILDSFANRFCPLVRSFVMLLVIECFKRRGLYSMHAACLAKNGRGVILTGTGQEARNALSLAMVGAGFECIAGELIILNRIGPILGAMAFPVDMLAKVENGRTARRSPTPNRGGHDSRREAADHGLILSACTPAVILFPRGADAERGALRTMKQSDALLELLPNVLLTNSYSSQAHLDVLGDLVCQCECFRLETGRDLNSAADMVARLIL